MEREKKTYKGCWIYLSLFFLVVFIILILFLLLFHDEALIKNNEGAVEEMTALTCEGDDVTYPILVGSGLDVGEIKVNLVFNERTLESISFIYKIALSNKDQIARGEARVHALMNESFANDGMGADSLGAVYSILDDALQISLYDVEKNINSTMAKYFLLDGVNGVFNQNSITGLYESKGLRCYTNN